jgi:hypothetical protein
MKPLDETREIRVVAVTVAVSFAATFAYLWRHTEPHLAAAIPPPSRPASPPSASPPFKMTPPIAAPSPEPAAPQPAPAPAATNAVPAANLDGPALPVLMSFATDAAPSGDAAENSGDSTGDETPRDQANILNTSDQLIAVTVIDTNSLTQKTHSTQVLIPPNGQAHINADSGLPLAPGDDITLRSAGFRDTSQRAP